jgi:DNA-directed RNA polymerase subunit L
MITIKAIRDLDMCEIVMEADDQTFERVASMGKELIKDDKQELFGYAVKKAIEDTIKERGGLR